MTYLSTILADSPTLVWALDETSGTVATDQSGNGNHGTYSGTYTLAGRNLWPSNDCVELGATGSVVIDTPITLSDQYSIEAWAVRETSTISGTYTSLIFGDDTLPSGFTVGLNQVVSDTYPDDGYTAVKGQSAATILGSFSVSIPGSTPADPGPYSSKQVHHYVLVCNDATRNAILYMDGQQVGSQSITPQTFETFATFTPRVGYDGSTADWIGGVGWVALYDGTALSAAQVLAHYEASGLRVAYDSGSLSAESIAFTADFGVTDSATLTDSELRTVFLYDTDDGTMTDSEQKLVNLYTTDSSLFSDISRFVNPYPEAVDVAYLAERAVLLPADPADWPFVGPYDFAITSGNSDFANAEVIYSTDPGVYDFVITSASTSDFTATQ